MALTTNTRSARETDLLERAKQRLPGGVLGTSRYADAAAFVVKHGKGSKIYDVSGREYIDYVLASGPLILGHAHPGVVAAIADAAALGTTFGAPTELELRLVERVIGVFPSIEMLRFVSSGTEAVMSAVRLARAATGRRAVLKFDGCYHGHADALLAAAGSGVATLGLPDSPGVPPTAVADTLIAPYNDLDAVERLFAGRPGGVAAVLVEPVAGNMGLVPPKPGFLEGLREISRRAGALLIFDEVMTGWRVHPRGAQGLFGIEPDLTCLGKVLGGGLPAAAYGGRRDLMEQVAPSGPVYQAGTLSGNPLAMAAGIATLDILGRPGLWDRAERWADRAADAMSRAAAAAGVPLTVQRVGTMFTPFFTDRPVDDFAAAKQTDRAAFSRFFHAMLDAGVYLPPSAFEAAFTSASHGDAELAVLEEALSHAFR